MPRWGTCDTSNLLQLVKVHGGDWTTISKTMHRSTSSCRGRVRRIEKVAKSLNISLTEYMHTTVDEDAPRLMAIHAICDVHLDAYLEDMAHALESECYKDDRVSETGVVASHKFRQSENS